MRAPRLVLAAAALALFAQPMSAQLLTLGVKGGATFSTLESSSPDFSDVDRRTGRVIGAALSLGGGTIGIRPEILLVQKGFETTAQGADLAFDVDYIEIPILLVARFDAGGVRPAIYGGPALGLERSCSISGNGLDFTATGDCDAPNVDLERETTDLGAAFGAELGIRFGGIYFVADARYTVGLTDLDAEPDDDEESKNRVFMLTGGIEIPIG